MTLSMELTEKVERIRDLTALDAAEELVRLPADDIQFILSRLPASQAATIASHLGRSPRRITRPVLLCSLEWRPPSVN